MMQKMDFLLTLLIGKNYKCTCCCHLKKTPTSFIYEKIAFNFYELNENL